jgi:1-acyl-sn-glycerol-3-phosphate acyltransferase
MSWPGFWTLNIYKDKNIPNTDLSKGPFILAPNHTSIIDTLYIAILNYKKTYSYNLKWSWVPLFGQLCLLADYIGIDKIDMKKIKSTKSRWACVYKNFPQCVICEKNIFMLTTEDD